MIKNIDLKFNKSSILTKVMLDELYEFPKDIVNIYYDKNYDGILQGTQLNQKDDNWYINKGLIKFDGDLYRMNEDLNLSKYINNLLEVNLIKPQSFYKLVIVKEENSINIDNRPTQIQTTLTFKVFGGNEKIKNKFIIFSDFMLINNNILPNLNFNNLIDSKEFNMIDCPYSYKGYITFHPTIFKCINDYLIEKSNKTGIEYVMINEILTNSVLDINFIKTLINDKSEKKYMLFKIDTLEEKELILRDFIKVIQKSFNIVKCIEEVPKEESDEKFNIGSMLW